MAFKGFQCMNKNCDWSECTEDINKYNECSKCGSELGHIRSIEPVSSFYSLYVDNKEDL